MIMMIFSQIRDIDEDKRRVRNGGDTLTESVKTMVVIKLTYENLQVSFFFFTAFSEDIIDSVMQYVLYAGDKQ